MRRRDSTQVETYNKNRICYIYIALFWVLKALYTKGVNLLNNHQCAASTWMMRRQSYCVQDAHRTPAYWWREDRVIKPIRVWGWLGGHDSQTANGQIRPGSHSYTPTLFEGHPGIFLWPQRARTSILQSHPKDGAFYSIMSQSLHWGVRIHTDCRVSNPCWPH